MLHHYFNVVIFIILIYRIAFADREPSYMEWGFIYIALIRVAVYSIPIGVFCLVLVCLAKDRNDGLFHKLIGQLTLTESFQSNGGERLDLRGDAGKKKEKGKIVFLDKNPEAELNPVEKFFDLSENQKKFDQSVDKLSQSIRDLKEYYSNMNEKSSIEFDLVSDALHR